MFKGLIAEDNEKQKTIAKKAKIHTKREILPMPKKEKPVYEDEDKSDDEEENPYGFVMPSLLKRLKRIEMFIHRKHEIMYETRSIASVKDISRRVIDSVNCDPSGDITKFLCIDDSYNTSNNEFFDVLDPRSSTLKEYLLQRICSEELTFDTLQDYEVLNEIIGMDDKKIRLSALIGARKPQVINPIKMNDSGIELNNKTRSRYENTAKMVKYLKESKMIDIDYQEFYRGGSKNIGIYPVPFEKLNFDVRGTRYYKLYVKDNSKNDTRNYNKLLAILAFIKFLIR